MSAALRFSPILFATMICACGNPNNPSMMDLESSTEDAPTVEFSPRTDSNQPEIVIRLLHSDEINYRTLKLYHSKKQMLDVMGKPDSIVEPKYDCGPYSEDSQGKRFFQYFYGKVNFIVHDSIAEIEQVLFSEVETMIIKDVLLTGKMSSIEVLEKFGFRKPRRSLNYLTIVPAGNMDEHYLLEFKSDRLHKFSRYQPC